MKKFLQKSQEIETLAAEVYRDFAKSSEGNEKLAEIWLQMAKDEEDHALALKLALRVPHEEAFEKVSENCPDPDELKTLMTEISERAKSGTASEYEMLRDAVSLENNFRKFHATYALVFKEESLLKTFKALARADELHLEHLNEYIREYKAKN